MVLELVMIKALSHWKNAGFLGENEKIGLGYVRQ